MTGHVKKIMLMCGMLSAFLLAGCGNEADIYPPYWRYKITVANLTYNQNFSPIIAVAHSQGYAVWQESNRASEAMERFAEGGEGEARDPNEEGSWLLTEAQSDPAVIQAVVSSVGGVFQGPGGGSSIDVYVSVPPYEDYRVTLLASLLFTNDGFTGISDVPLSDMAVDGKKYFYTKAYDAGTEKNTETEATVAGFIDFEVDENGNLLTDENGNYIPIAGMGEGYNPVRDDVVDLITIHTGVISKDETDPVKIIENSALDESHRFQQPVAKITIERIE